jgi:ankyrin repeat protein
MLVQVVTNPNTNAVQSAASRRGLPFRPDFYYRMTRAFNYDFNANAQCSVVDALATFGAEAKTAIPFLLVAGQGADANLRAHVAVAVQKIAPWRSDALAPLIKNLTEKDAQIRRQALWTLESLGANAAEALPMLVAITRNDPDLEVRKGAIDCISKIGQVNEDVIQAMNEILAGNNSSDAYAAYEVLAGFSERSKEAFVSLIKAMRTCPDRETRQQIKYHLQSAVSRNNTMLNKCVFGADPDARYEAMQLADQFGLDNSDSRMPLKMMLRDKNPEARILATNMLVQLDSTLYGRPVAELLIRGGDLNATNDQGLAALHVSAVSHQVAAITALLAAGANPNVKDNQGRTAVHLLLTEKWPWDGVVDTLSALVKGGASLSVPDNSGKTPLHYLAALGDRSPFIFMRGISNVFESTKMDIEARDNDGNTPLLIATKTGTTDVFSWLMKQGANFDSTNSAGESARLLIARNQSPLTRPLFARPIAQSAETDIFQAVHEGNVDAAARLIKADPQFANQTDQFQQTPLRAAVMQHQTNMIRFLETHGAKWDEGSAVLAGRTDVLKSIIQQTPSAVSTKVLDKGLAHIAAANGDVGMLKILIAANADLQAKDRWGLSPLGYALIKNYPDMQALLLQHGAQENIFDAVYADDLKTATVLLAQDKSLAASTAAEKISAVEIAAAAGHTNILKLLLKNGAPFNSAVQPSKPHPTHLPPFLTAGWNPVSLAAFYNQSDALALLIHAGAKVDQVDQWGFAPLHWAAIRGSTEAAALLLKHKADPNQATAQIPSQVDMPISLYYARDQQTPLGETPLHLAVLCGETNMVQLLLKSGADVNAVNDRLQSPLDLADGMPPMNSIELGMIQRGMLNVLEPLGADQTLRKQHQAIMDEQKVAAALLEAAGGKHL